MSDVSDGNELSPIRKAQREAADWLHGADRPGGLDCRFAGPLGLVRALIQEADRRIAQAWDERSKARPQYLGPNDGHYEDCGGWGDCYCASYPNPYREGWRP